MSQGPPTSGGAQEPQPPEPVQPAVPAGWYPHPTAPGWEAYWDGAAWGAETRPAQPAAQEPAAQETVAQEPVSQEPVAQQPAAQEPVAREPQTAVQAAQPHEAGAAQAQPAAVPVATATAPSAAKEGSDSSMSLVLCLLGAIVAIVGSFLPMATSDVNAVDIADNSLFAADYGIAVIALAVLGAGIAAYCYVKDIRTWLPILLGALIVAIAAYVGLAGLDNLDADGATLQNLAAPGPGGGTPDQDAIDAAIQNSGALSGAVDGTASTGIFVTGIGGLLIALGGIGIARQPK